MPVSVASSTAIEGVISPNGTYLRENMYCFACAETGVDSIGPHYLELQELPPLFPLLRPDSPGGDMNCAQWKMTKVGQRT